MRRVFWLLGLLFPAFALAETASMTEIRYEDAEPGQVPYLSRLLIQADRLRLDHGQDGNDYILFDASVRSLFQVSSESRRILEIPVIPVRYDWPQAWQLRVEAGGSKANKTLRVELDGRLCLDLRSTDLLREQMALLAAFQVALAGNQARTWQATPEDLRDPCVLAVEVREAGIEYRQGLPLLIRYGDGRQRRYLSHSEQPLRPELFRLPEGYERFALP